MARGIRLVPRWRETPRPNGRSSAASIPPEAQLRVRPVSLVLSTHRGAQAPYVRAVSHLRRPREFPYPPGAGRGHPAGLRRGGGRRGRSRGWSARRKTASHHAISRPALPSLGMLPPHVGSGGLTGGRRRRARRSAPPRSDLGVLGVLAVDSFGSGLVRHDRGAGDVALVLLLEGLVDAREREFV